MFLNMEELHSPAGTLGLPYEAVSMSSDTSAGLSSRLPHHDTRETECAAVCGWKGGPGQEELPSWKTAHLC